jgi:HD-GYP domain-containing protein (c-di-GMP phosphodiesterase class II)
MALLEIPVEELSFGMYVSKLDRPWTETPFVFQGFILKTDKQLEVLKAHCKRVFVDPEKMEVADPVKVTAADLAKIRGSTVYTHQASVEAELPRAANAANSATVVVRELSKAVEAGATIDSGRSREAAAQITESVVRNPDAMALLVKLQQKSGETLSRAIEVSVLMTIFGRFLQLPQEKLELLGMLGLLQDVGKLKLPRQLATRAPTNPDEVAVYQKHVDYTVEILGATPGLPHELTGLASLHHERFDGTGYPRGIRGDAIALPGMIAGIVDAFDALTAPPPFGDNMATSNALSVLYKGRGKQFHAALVEQFIQCIGVYPVGSVVQLNSGEVAVVIAQNMVRRLQPRIMVVKDAKGVRLRPYKMLDLMKEPKAGPDQPYRIEHALESESVQIDPKELFL